MTIASSTRSRSFGPAWDIALLYPEQGHWTEDDYLALTANTNRMIELSNGCLEVLPTPKTSHQLIVQYLHGELFAFVNKHRLGRVLFSPLRVRLWSGTFREPDIVFMLSRRAKRVGEDFWEGADLVVEVVSGSSDDRKRDLVTKKREYARAGISEYWVVDPKEERIVSFKLKDKRYVIHSQATGEGEVKSALLAGFSVQAEDVFAAGKEESEGA